MKKLLLFTLAAFATSALAEEVFFEYNGKQYPATLLDNSYAQALLKRAPLTMSFEDLGKSERISYLKYPLPLTREKFDYTPKKGDIAYWAPRRNLTVFMDEPTYKAQLVPIGHVAPETLEMIRTSQSWLMTLVRKEEKK